MTAAWSSLKRACLDGDANACLQGGLMQSGARGVVENERSAAVLFSSRVIVAQ